MLYFAMFLPFTIFLILYLRDQSTTTQWDRSIGLDSNTLIYQIGMIVGGSIGLIGCILLTQYR